MTARSYGRDRRGTASTTLQLVQEACVDGALVPLEEALIPVTDEGLLRGDGVFEVMRLYDGVPFAREAHLRRMALSAQNLRLELDLAGIGRDIEPLPEMPETLKLGYVEYEPVRLLDGIKSLSYGANMLATRLAKERGFDEA